MKHEFSAPFLALLAISCMCCASAQNHAHAFRVTPKGLSYVGGQREILIPMKTTINSWSVNCDRTQAVAWGVPWDQLRIGDVPYSEVYLIDLINEDVTGRFSVSSGPYEVTFDKDNQLASVDDQIVDVISGSVIGMAGDIKFNPQSCPSAFDAELRQGQN